MTILLIGGFPDHTPKYETLGARLGLRLIHCPYRIPRTHPKDVMALVVFRQMCCHGLYESALRLGRIPRRYVKTRALKSLETVLVSLKKDLTHVAK